jgi:hypothetical protein
MWKSFHWMRNVLKKAAIPRVKARRSGPIHQEKAGKQSGKSPPRRDLSKPYANNENSVFSFRSKAMVKMASEPS